ncbi:MAG: mechanosensitive ion channel protein MscS, partial [Pseudolabrys sp.]|nr:mechanosensitive ion channel protein MscS [Pseudolabrys sp.]
MDYGDFNEALTAFMQAARFTLRSELTSIWLPIQFGLIILSAIIAWAIAAVIRKRMDLVNLTMAWPPVFRLLVRAFTNHLGLIAFILVATIVRSSIRAEIPQPRTYLLLVAVNLSTAWLVINVLTSIIQNQFVNRIVTVTAWTIAALSILRLLDPVTASLDSPAVTIFVGGLRITPLLVMKTTALLLLALWAANVISNFLARRVQNVHDLTPSLQVLISKLIRIALFTLAVVIALNSLGIDLSVLALFSGAVGVGL